MATFSKTNGALLLLKCLVALCMLDSVGAGGQPTVPATATA